MAHNNPETPIKIYKQLSNDDYDPMVEDLYDGRIKDIPAELQHLTVYSTGWFIGAQRYAVNVGYID